MKSYGECVKEARCSKGWSQSKLARKSGVPITSIRNIEQGRSNDPKLSTVEAIAEALEITIDNLIHI